MKKYSGRSIHIRLIAGTLLIAVTITGLFTSCPSPLNDGSNGNDSGAVGRTLPIAYVSTSGNDGNTGDSPSTPLATISTAADRVIDGGEIRITGGTFHETVTLFGVSASILGSWGVDFSNVDFASHPTIIDGSGFTGNVIVGSYADLVLDRLVLTNGTAGYGAGVCYDNGTLTITNSTISNNTATEWGGAGVNVGTCELTITDTTICKNSATREMDSNGGGLNIGSSTASLTRVEISGNTCAGNAGGGAFIAESTVTVTDSTIGGNSGVSYGGGINNWNSTVYLIDSTIENNVAEISGGGISTSGDGTQSTALSGVFFSNNSPQDSQGGPCTGLFTLSAISPDSGNVFDLVTLTGEGFGAARGEKYYLYLIDTGWNVVEFIYTIFWSETEIQFRIPNVPTAGEYYLGFVPWIGGSIFHEPSPSLAIDSVIDPSTNSFSVTSVSTTEVIRDETLITANGTGFLDYPGAVQINRMNDLQRIVECQVETWTDTEITFLVPSDIPLNFYGDSVNVSNLLGQSEYFSGSRLHYVPAAPTVSDSDWSNYIALQAENVYTQGGLTYQLFRSDTIDGTYTQVSSFPSFGIAPLLVDASVEPSTTYYCKYRIAAYASSTDGEPFSLPAEATSGTAAKNFTVVFDFANGSPLSEVQLPAGATVTVDPLPTKPGYTLSSWTSQTNFITQLFDINADVVMSDMTLISGWLLSAPQNLTATVDSATSIRLDWDANPAATAYLVKRDSIDVATVTGTFYVDTGLVTGIFYGYHVYPIGADEGGYSSYAYLKLEDPLQQVTGATITSATTFLDPSGLITYAFGSSDVCTRTVTGSPDMVYSGTWQYSGDNLVLSTTYDAGEGTTIVLDETYNAGYTLNGGADLYLYGYQRTAGSVGEIEGTWEFSYRADTTMNVSGTQQSLTYIDITATITFNANGTWFSSVLTRTDTDPTGTAETDNGIWDTSDLTAGMYKLVDFGDREFLHLDSIPAYTRQ